MAVSRRNPIRNARAWRESQKILHAVVGFNGRGTEHISALSKIPGTRLVALCGASTPAVLEKGILLSLPPTALRVLGYFRHPKTSRKQRYQDAVTFAVPNHWHALGSIWAVQAGKDVYVEKPVSHNVWEGRKSLEAARKYNRMVQTGTQCRSSVGLQEAIAWIQAGNLGKLSARADSVTNTGPASGSAGGPQPFRLTCRS